MQPPISGFTYHIVPQIQERPGQTATLLAPLIRDGYWKTFQIPPLESLRSAKELGAELRLAGIVPTFDIGGTVSDGELNLQCPDADRRAAALEQACRLVDQAYALGAAVADFNPGPDPGASRRPAELANLSDSLARLCDYAAKRAVNAGGPSTAPLVISLEHFDREVDKRRILGPTAEAAQFIQGLRKLVPNVGMTMDLSHLVLLGEDPAEAVRLARGLVTNAHLSNCVPADRGDPRWGDRHPPFFVPGGAVDANTLSGFLSALAEIGYFDKGSGSGGTLTFQVKPAPEEDSLVVAAACRRLLREGLSRVACPTL